MTKNYKPKCLSATTKNLNWQILTKNLVSFERLDGVKDEKNVNIMGVHQKNNIYGELPKKGGTWTICRGLGKK